MILLTTDDTLNGGIAKFCRNLDDFLSFRKKILFTRKRDASYTSNYDNLFVLGKAPILLFNFFSLFKKIEQSEKVILNDPQGSLLTLFLVFFVKPIKKVDVYFISHGFLFHNNASSKIKATYFNFLIRFVFPRLTLVSVSENDTRILSEFNTQPNTEIFHGIDFVENDEKVVKEYEFCCVARDVPHKNLDSFFDFCNHLSYKKNIKSILITDSNRFANRLASLEVRSDLSDQELSNILNSSNFFISFSSYEGFGLAALEAVGQGCKPILYKNTSFEKIFKDYSYALFSDLNTDSALHAYNNYPIENFSQLFEDLKLNFSKQIMAQKYMGLLK